eukprot:gene3689-6503_t
MKMQVQNSSSVFQTGIQRSAVVNLEDIIMERKTEIKNLAKLIKDQNKYKGRRTFQKLPRYARRRTMSWNLHRIPKYLRKAAMHETLPARIRHRKRRKFVRKKNMGNKPKRLKTHVFHAKRFQMQTMFNYKIALHSCFKVFKTTYRFQRQHCTIFDSSFHVCFQLFSETQNLILNFLKKLNFDFNFTNSSYTSGKREGKVLIFEDYPMKCIGPISFIWKQKEKEKNFELFLWIHPLMKEDVLKLFKNEKFKFIQREDLNRFELRGPNSIFALNSALKVNQDLNKEENLKTWKIMKDHVKIPSALPRNIILSLGIDHPLSTKEDDELKDEMMEEVTETLSEEEMLMLNIPNDISSSDLWDDKESYSDVMLIQQEGDSNGFGSGIDLICSSSHASHLYAQIAKLSRVLPIGLYDRNRMLTEIEVSNYPQDFPDALFNKQKKNVFVDRNINKIQIEKEKDCLIRVCLEMNNGGLPHENGIIYKMPKKKTKNAIKYDDKLEVLGFISSPILSLRRGHGFAVGFCEKEKILKIVPKKTILKTKEANVLIWNPKQQHMYPVHLYISNE